MSAVLAGAGDAATLPMDAALSNDAEQLASLLAVALAAVAIGRAERKGPLPTGGPEAVAVGVHEALAGAVLPDRGAGAGPVLSALARAVTAGSADPAHPLCAAHLHCPPLAVAVAADTVASMLNQSLDSWDQAPAATELERRVVGALAELVGYEGTRSGGVLTSGGTESNLMGLLLARERAVATSARIFCSSLAHFSIARCAGVLGLGADATVTVPVDADHRMDPAALDRAMTAAERRGETPVAVVATAGTTDFGSIDPLPEVAEVARRHGAWLHVDAAYGGGALLSERLAPLLGGIDRADSVALDLHKLGWQPVAAGVFLARDERTLAPLSTRVGYLNPLDDEDAGFPSLLGHSLRTTRRADVLKIAVTLRSLGREGLGLLVERCHDLARYAADRIAADPRLEMYARPALSTVVFSYAADKGDPSVVNAGLRRRLLRQGRAVVGRTEHDGVVRLKLTLLNPHATPADVDRLLDVVVTAGEEVDR